MNYQKISFCTVVMNRLHHLKETLPQNLKDNEDYANLEFIIVDYNSSDEIEEWIKTNLGSYIESGKLHFFKTNTPNYFDRSHSRNIAFKLASGDILCNVDADNFTGKGFASYINNEFSLHKNIFLTADTKRKYYFLRNAFGRYCVSKKDFHQAGGLNEEMKSYGSETTDFYERLETAGVKEKIIMNTNFLQAISHDDEERISNEFFIKSLEKLYLRYISYYESELLILYNDNTFEKCKISAKTKESYLPASLIENSLEKGSWTEGGDDLELFSETNTFSYKLKEENIFLADNHECIFHQIKNQQFLIEIAKNYSFVTNSELKTATKDKKQYIVNENGFGIDTVYHNFSKTPIVTT